MKRFFEKRAASGCGFGNALRSPTIRRCEFLFALQVVVAGLVLASGCAHDPAKAPGAAATIDLVGKGGLRTTLSPYRGQVLVVELCASWSDPCLANSRAVSEACEVLCHRDDVHMVTILLDDLGPQGLLAYDILDVLQPVFLAGPNAREGKSALGPLTVIPRVLIFDREGVLVDEQSGGIANSSDIIAAVLRHV